MSSVHAVHANFFFYFYVSFSVCVNCRPCVTLRCVNFLSTLRKVTYSVCSHLKCRARAANFFYNVKYLGVHGFLAQLIAKFLRGMCQMQKELRVVRQGQEETTQWLSQQTHRDNFIFKKKGNECQCPGGG